MMLQSASLIKMFNMSFFLELSLKNDTIRGHLTDDRMQNFCHSWRGVTLKDSISSSVIFEVFEQMTEHSTMKMGNL